MEQIFVKTLPYQNSGNLNNSLEEIRYFHKKKNSNFFQLINEASKSWAEANEYNKARSGLSANFNDFSLQESNTVVFLQHIQGFDKLQKFSMEEIVFACYLKKKNFNRRLNVEHVFFPKTGSSNLPVVKMSWN